MKIRVERQIVKVSRHGGSVEVDPEEIGFRSDDVIGRQFIAFPLNDQAAELIIVSSVFDDEEKQAREQLKAQLNEDILGQVEDEE